MISSLPAARRVYLDHAATTPLGGEARGALEAALTACYGNPSSLHEEGRAARETLESARQQIRQACGAGDFDLIFTSGGTESNHTALLGCILADRELAGGRPPGAVVVSAVEHPSVLAAESLGVALGSPWRVVACTAEGRVNLEALTAAVQKGALLASVQWANNETGALQPITAVGELARRHGVLLHTDAVQALGKVPLLLDDAPVDLATISAHKIGGPKGIAGLLVRRGTPLRALLRGGSQELGLRAGTENPPLAAAFAAAVRQAESERQEQMTRLAALRALLEAGLRQRWPRLRVNSPSARTLPTILNVSFPWIEGESLVRLLDWHGVAASTGSACSAGAQKPSHVLAAMGLADREVRGSLRLALGRANSAEDLPLVFTALERAVSQLEGLAPA